MFYRATALRLGCSAEMVLYLNTVWSPDPPHLRVITLHQVLLLLLLLALLLVLMVPTLVLVLVFVGVLLVQGLTNETGHLALHPRHLPTNQEALGV